MAKFGKDPTVKSLELLLAGKPGDALAVLEHIPAKPEEYPYGGDAGVDIHRAYSYLMREDYTKALELTEKSLTRLDQISDPPSALIAHNMVIHTQALARVQGEQKAGADYVQRMVGLGHGENGSRYRYEHVNDCIYHMVQGDDLVFTKGLVPFDDVLALTPQKTLRGINAVTSDAYRDMLP